MNCVESCSPQVNTGSAMGVNQGSTGSFSEALERGGISGMVVTELDGREESSKSCGMVNVSDVDRRLDRGLSGPLFRVSEEGCVDVLARAG